MQDINSAKLSMFQRDEMLDRKQETRNTMNALNISNE